MSSHNDEPWSLDGLADDESGGLGHTGKVRLVHEPMCQPGMGNHPLYQLLVELPENRVGLSSIKIKRHLDLSSSRSVHIYRAEFVLLLPASS